MATALLLMYALAAYATSCANASRKKRNAGSRSTSSRWSQRSSPTSRLLRHPERSLRPVLPPARVLSGYFGLGSKYFKEIGLQPALRVHRRSRRSSLGRGAQVAKRDLRDLRIEPDHAGQGHVRAFRIPDSARTTLPRRAGTLGKRTSTGSITRPRAAIGTTCRRTTATIRRRSGA